MELLQLSNSSIFQHVGDCHTSLRTGVAMTIWVYFSICATKAGRSGLP